MRFDMSPSVHASEEPPGNDAACPVPASSPPVNATTAKERIETAQFSHMENTEDNNRDSKWKLSKKGRGDVALALFGAPDEVHEPIEPDEEKKLVRKVDLMILPYLAVCYAFFYIDKTTLSYAAIFGIREDLELVGSQYSWLSSMFYFGFLAWALPTNLLLQRLPVGRYLGFNIFLWGAFLMMQAAVNSFSGLAALRALSGAAEACSDPAFILITAMWYTRRQQPIRIGLWYTANGFGIAMGGLLGFGIGNIKGSLPSWKFEFLIIGALCCVWGIVMFVLLPDSPVTAKGLSTREKRIAVERLRDDQTGIENKAFKWYQAREVLLEPKLYLFYLLGVTNNLPNGGVSNFGTIIIRGMGFSTLETTLMQIPYGFIISCVILSAVFLNDHLSKRGMQTRSYFIVLYLLPNIAGAFGLRYLQEHNRAGRLICYYLTSGFNASFVLVLSMATANTAGHTKKVITNAVLFLGYCTGNLAGPFFYLSSQAPYYPLGIWSMIVSHLLQIVVILVLREILRRENTRRDRLQGVTEGGLDGRDLDATAFGDMTDKENLNFRYIY